MERQSRISRRDFLKAAGVGGAAVAVLGGGATYLVSAVRKEEEVTWDREADVVVVGSGAAGSAAAVTAHHEGNLVIILEKAPAYGGTSAKSGGGYWIPNNFALREAGIQDRREDAIRYMARYSYPHLYDPTDPRLGLPENGYNLIAAFYDNASKAVDFLAEIGALQSAGRLPGNPDYLEHAPENKVPRGRSLGPKKPDGTRGNGAEMMRQMKAWVDAEGIPVLLEHRVRRIVVNDKGEVVGVEAVTQDGKAVTVRSRKGVVFGSGGYTHNRELVLNFQPGPIFGGCAVPTAEGDFIYVAEAIGAKLGNMPGAWHAEIVLEQALEFSSVPNDVWQPIGDSMILVNKYGKRVVSEKRNYNDRTKIHFVWDPVKAEYVNQFLFMVYDQRNADLYAGNYPLPAAGASAPYVISGQTLAELAQNIRDRLTKIASRIGIYRLDQSFDSNLEATIALFNQFAEKGVDEDFQRGAFPYDVEWHSGTFSIPRKDTPWPLNDRPNITMYPISSKGPYYAIILAAGTLDTNGGPVISEKAQVLDTEDRPIPGLYGAGNCIASPTARAYYAGGSTLGPALTFGYIAGLNAAKEPVKQVGRVAEPVAGRV
ncbi:MAG: FAD-dependent oxidoreductase [Chloroflexi bacterium]|nr:FAD-dependent oxidoreductase [Chloroflexota bacterium]